MRIGLIALLLTSLGLLAGCALGLAVPDPSDDDDTFPSLDDDDDPDDDDADPDDDDVAPDDDDIAPDDDDVAPDDDDVAPDDDDVAPDDDDVAPDDDDVAPDDDDIGPDDDDTTPPPDDDDIVLDDDDTTPAPDDDDIVPDDDDATPPGCVDDGYEDNDADSAPASVGGGPTPDLVTCDGDEDWFAFDVAIAEMVSVDVVFSDAEGDIDLQLFDPSGTFLTGSQSVDDDEAVGPLQAQVAGDYLARVWLWSDAGSVPGNEYDLVVTTDPPVCVDDGYEDNDSPATAAPISPGTISDLQVCAADGDYWEVPLSAGETVAVFLAFDDGEGDIDLRLKDAGGTTLASSLSVTDDEAIPSFTASGGGDYLIEVDLWSDAGPFPGNAYDLTVSLPGCLDDDLEPNASSLTATTTGSYAFSDYGLSLCTGDVDWFERDLSAGETIEVDVLFEDAAGDVDLEFYVPPSADWADGSYSGTDDESFTFTATTTGTHFFRLYLYSDGGAPGQGYDLFVDDY